MNTIKSIIAVFTLPVLLIICFQSNQIESKQDKSPTVETPYKAKSVKSAVKSYLLAVNVRG